MKIGIISEVIFKHATSIKDACKKLKKIGYDGLDFSIFYEWATPNPIFSEPREKWVNHFKELRNIIEGEGLKVFQTHGTYRSDFDPDNMYYFTPMVVDQFAREIEATAILGSKYIVIHPINMAVLSKNKELDFERNMSEFSKLTPILKQFGVKNGVEDMFIWDNQCRFNTTTGCSTPDDMIRYIDGHNDRDAYCACLDTGHMLIHRIDPAAAVRKLGDRLELLHVHDNDGITDLHAPIGFGITYWDELIKALKEINYKGVFSLEVSFGKYSKHGEKAFWNIVEYTYESAKNLLDSCK